MQPPPAEQTTRGRPSVSGLLAQLIDEFTDRLNRGERPDVEAYARRFPDLADLLRQVLPVVGALGGAEQATSPSGAVPGYQVVEALGQGGMGVVYLARHLALGRLVAIKKVRAAPGDEPSVARFKREAEAVARLNHPNIVQVYEVGEHQGQPWIALEYVAGGNLTAWRQAPRPAEVVAGLVRQLALAVQAAHEAGVVHRDLKPANVLLTENGTPKVTDFGLAKLLGDDALRQGADAALTQTGAIVGTPAYMAPEQAGGAEEVGPAVDVWAMGAILYELLTGRPPFVGADLLDTLSQVRGRDPVPPAQLAPRCPGDLNTICLKCLEKEPARRYASARELADDLGRFLEGRPILARPAPWWERLGRWAWRNPVVACLSGLLVVGGLASLVVTTTLWQLAVARAEREGAAKKRAVDAAGQEARAKRQAQEAARQEALALREARAAAARETAAREEAEGRLYLRNVALADQRWREGNAAAAEALLDQCPARRRAWEWRYLKARCGAARRAILARYAVGLGAVACSPGGETLAVASGKLIELREVATGKVLGTLEGHRNDVVDLAFSADGRMLASASGRVVGLGAAVQGEAILWDVKRRKARHTLKGLSAVAMPSGGGLVKAPGLLVTVGERGLLLYDVNTGKALQEAKGHPAPISAVAVSPKGTHVASADAFGVVLLWELGEGRRLVGPRRLPSVGRGVVPRLTFRDDGAAVAAVESAGALQVWDVASGRRVLLSKDHPGRPGGLAWLTGGALATAGGDGAVRLRDPVTGRTLATFAGHTGAVTDLRAHPDGKRLASAGQDGTLRVWDALERPGVITLARLPKPVQCVALGPNGEVASACEDGGVRLHEPGGKTHSLGGLGGPALRVAWSPDAALVASGGQDGSVVLWDARARARRKQLAEKGPMVLGLSFSSDGRWLAAARKGGLAVWRVADGRLVNAVTGTAMKDQPTGVAFVENRLHALAVDGRVIIRDVDEKGALVRRALWPRVGPGMWVALAASPSGKGLAVGGATLNLSGETRLVGEGGKLVRAWGGPPSMVYGVAFTPDGSRLLAASWDGAVHVYGPTSEEELLRIDAHEGSAYTVAARCDGALVTGGRDGAVLLHPNSTAEQGGGPPAPAGGP